MRASPALRARRWIANRLALDPGRFIWRYVTTRRPVLPKNAPPTLPPSLTFLLYRWYRAFSGYDVPRYALWRGWRAD